MSSSARRITRNMTKAPKAAKKAPVKQKPKYSHQKKEPQVMTTAYCEYLFLPH